jgi:hypothetical protein
MWFDTHARCRRPGDQRAVISNGDAATTTSYGDTSPAHGHGHACTPDGYSHTCAADADIAASHQYSDPDAPPQCGQLRRLPHR